MKRSSWAMTPMALAILLGLGLAVTSTTSRAEDPKPAAGKGAAAPRPALVVTTVRPSRNPITDTLAANGSLGGSVSVSSGAVLAGSGSVGLVSITTGATLSPGNSPGTLTTGAMTWAGGGNYNWQLFDAAGAAGTGWGSLGFPPAVLRAEGGRS